MTSPTRTVVGAVPVKDAMFHNGARRARVIFRRALDLFPWTPLGLCVVALAVGTLQWFAFSQLDLVWLVVGYVALALSVLSPVSVVGAAAWLRLRAHEPGADDPLLLETGTPFETGFALPSLRWFPLASLRWRWLSPRAEVDCVADGARLREHVRVADRGRHAGLVRCLVIEDPFGLSRVSLHERSPRPVDALPRLGALSRVRAVTAMASGDALSHPMGLDEGDRLELRQYTPGDPARFIHWKVFGRTRKLMVRMPERALEQAQRTAAFLVAGDGDDATAALARLAIERRLLGNEWVFGSDLSPDGTEDADRAMDAVMRSITVRDGGAAALGSFLKQADLKGPSALIVFAPPTGGPWVDAVSAVARARRVRVLIGTDGVDRGQSVPLWRRLLLFGEPADGVPVVELERVVHQLRNAGCDPVVFDRGAGQAMSEQHEAAMWSGAREQRA